MDKWGTEDGDFNLIEFYHLIMLVLSRTDDPWVIDTMGWWQRYASHDWARVVNG